MAIGTDPIRTLGEQVARQRQLQNQLASLRDQRRGLEMRERELAAARAAEQADVDKLEGGSLTACFLRLTGKLEDRMDKERAEAAQAAVRHDAVRRELEAVDWDIGAASEELAALAGCEERYRTALTEKARTLKAAGTAAGSRLLELEERTAFLTGQRRELREAREAGLRALETADGILASLDSAESWSTWDLLGGGLISDLAKHDRLEEAQRQVEALQVQLRRFRTELADVRVQADLQVQVDGFLGFADFFFDGLFADWAVMDHIHSSQRQARDTRDQIQSVLERLEKMAGDVDWELASLGETYDRLVTQG